MLSTLRPRALLATLLALAACRGAREPSRVAPIALAFPFEVDSQSVEVIAPGVVRRAFYAGAGPWGVHLLDVDPSRCWTLAALKAGDGAVGRAGTLALARMADTTRGTVVAGAVNADFFSFTPPGVPTGLHVQRDTLVTGPSGMPSIAVGADGRARIASYAVAGALAGPDDSLPLAAWNPGLRASDAATLAVFDARYGARTDSIAGRLALRLAAVGSAAGRPRVRLVRPAGIDTAAVIAIPRDGWIVATTAATPPAIRARLVALATSRDALRLALAITPDMPRDAVTGRPMLVRDGTVNPDLDASGAASFVARNPRTAVGITPAGHLLLVAVDGRQPGYSDGMSLGELAALMRALGATDALNLDGGGSTTLVAREPSGALRIVNRPSDKDGERPVGNALAVVRGCAADAPNARGR